jgi:hypothetical protein
MAAGPKEQESQDTSSAVELDAVSAEASELRRRLLAVGSNDNAERRRARDVQCAAPLTANAPHVIAQRHGEERERALRETAKFVRRRQRDAGGEEETVTAVSGEALPARSEAALEGGATAPVHTTEHGAGGALSRPPRVRIMVPLVAGALLVLVALIHRSIDAARTSALARAPAHAVPSAAQKPGLHDTALRGVSTASGALSSTAVSSTAAPSTAVPSTAVPSTAVPSTAVPTPGPSQLAGPSGRALRPTPGEQAARMLAAARSKALARIKPAPSPESGEARLTPVAESVPEAAPANAAAPEPTPPRARPRLVEDRVRPSLLD